MSSKPQDLPLRLLSIEEYARLQESDETMSELVEGVLVREPRPGIRHGHIQSGLAWAIETHLRREALAAPWSPTSAW